MTDLDGKTELVRQTAEDLEKRYGSAVGTQVAGLPGPARPLHERMLFYGVVEVIVSEDLDVPGYDKPGRFYVAVGGEPATIISQEFDKVSGSRTIVTNLGTVFIPPAIDRAHGAKVTINGTPVAGQ